METKHSKNKGFTLVETIVVIFIFTLLATGVNTLFTHIFTNSRGRLASIDTIDQARAVTTDFTNEIRVASVANDGSWPITQAENYQITFYSNYGQATGTVAKVRYYLATSTLYKAVTVPTGSPLTYNPANEKISVLQKNLTSTTTPIFYYYDGDYTGSSTPLVQPVNINQVKYVKINFTTNFTISAGASIRNLKTNLGN